jgi:hypothetical protein
VTKSNASEKSSNEETANAAHACWTSFNLGSQASAQPVNNYNTAYDVAQKSCAGAFSESHQAEQYDDGGEGPFAVSYHKRAAAKAVRCAAKGSDSDRAFLLLFAYDNVHKAERAVDPVERHDLQTREHEYVDSALKLKHMPKALLYTFEGLKVES